MRYDFFVINSINISVGHLFCGDRHEYQECNSREKNDCRQHSIVASGGGRK
jgi:hypothetical protein